MSAKLIPPSGCLYAGRGLIASVDVWMGNDTVIDAEVEVRRDWPDLSGMQLQ